MSQEGRKSKLNLIGLRAKVVARSIVDEQGNCLFSESDVVALGGKSALALQRVFEVGQRLSGMTDSDVEELAGN